LKHAANNARRRAMYRQDSWPPGELIDKTLIDTHTHTHTHTQRERERQTSGVVNAPHAVALG